jgi:hypothetical protein
MCISVLSFIVVPFTVQLNNNNNNNNNNNYYYYYYYNNNSILYYLCAEPTATRPITDTAQCRYNTIIIIIIISSWAGITGQL